MGKYTLEICTGSYFSALAARNGGADRLELCSGLAEGGITPSVGLMKKVMAIEGIRKHVLIRPRGGDFLYTKAEQEIMADDIKAARDLGADGVVIGALRADGFVDTACMQKLMNAAGSLSVTFHRAFDVCADPLRNLEEIIGLGVDRILTSGQADKAVNGISLLQQLVERAGGRLIVMPGCGVSTANVRDILTMTGAVEVHASASSLKPSGMLFRHQGVSMGTPGSDEYATKESDEQIVREIRQIIDAI